MGESAERLAEGILRDEGYVVHRFRNVRVKHGRMDFFQDCPHGFGDLMAWRGDEVVLVEVTDGGSVSARKQRARRVAWPPSWRVEIWDRHRGKDTFCRIPL